MIIIVLCHQIGMAFYIAINSHNILRNKLLFFYLVDLWYILAAWYFFPFEELFPSPVPCDFSGVVYQVTWSFLPQGQIIAQPEQSE